MSFVTEVFFHSAMHTCLYFSWCGCPAYYWRNVT